MQFLETLMNSTENQVRLSKYQTPMDKVKQDIREMQETADRYARAWERRDRERHEDRRNPPDSK
jgi:hypothetical protein